MRRYKVVLFFFLHRFAVWVLAFCGAEKDDRRGYQVILRVVSVTALFFHWFQTFVLFDMERRSYASQVIVKFNDFVVKTQEWWDERKAVDHKGRVTVALLGDRWRNWFEKNQFAIPFITILWPLLEHFTCSLQRMWLMEVVTTVTSSTFLLFSFKKIKQCLQPTMSGSLV